MRAPPIGLKRSVVILIIALFIAGGLAPFSMSFTVGAEGDEGSRDLPKGGLSQVTNPRTKAFRGLDWKPGTNDAYLVGQGAVVLYQDNGTEDVVQLDSTESEDHYYEEIAWRPQGDYALIVGATPASTRTKGLISKMWWEGNTIRITALYANLQTRLAGIEWSPDGTYAVIVGGARGGEDFSVNAVMLRYSHGSGLLTEAYTASDGVGLSDVEYNTAGEFFHASGLDGRIIQYDGITAVEKSDNALKATDFYAITWRDNGGTGIFAGKIGKSNKGHLVATDGNYNHAIADLEENYAYDADWAPGSDYSLIVGRSGSIWEYSPGSGIADVNNMFHTKHFYGVDFNDAGTVALIVGQDGSILKYTVDYPEQENYAPSVYITSPVDSGQFDYGVQINFSSNGTNDPDLDKLDYKWSEYDRTLDKETKISNDPYFTKDDLRAGKHTIYLEVDDSNDHTVKVSINITIRQPTELPSVNLGGDRIGYIGEPVEFDARVIERDSDIVAWNYDCKGDYNWSSTTKPSFDCSYDEEGIYTVTFKVMDDRNAQAEDSVTVTVFPKRTGDHDVEIFPQGQKLSPGDKVTVTMNMSSANRIEVQYVPPPGKGAPMSIPGGPNNGEYTAFTTINKGNKAGSYDIRWRYYDHNDNTTDWYTETDAFQVKKQQEDDGLGDIMGYLIAIVVVIIIVVVIVAFVFLLYKKSLSRVETALLIYRDGRMIHSGTPAQPGPGTPMLDYSAPGQIHTTVNGHIQNLIQGTARNLPSSFLHASSNVFIEQGMHTILVVAFSGNEPSGLRKKMKNVLQEIEIIYGNQLRQWDGLVTEMPRIQAIIDKNLSFKG
jgi:hypothetical protein